MIASLSFCTISLCIADAVKLAARIFSVNRSTYMIVRISVVIRGSVILEHSETSRRT